MTVSPLCGCQMLHQLSHVIADNDYRFLDLVANVSDDFPFHFEVPNFTRTVSLGIGFLLAFSDFVNIGAYQDVNPTSMKTCEAGSSRALSLDGRRDGELVSM